MALDDDSIISRQKLDARAEVSRMISFGFKCEVTLTADTKFSGGI